MRNAFIRELESFAATDDRVILLVGDIGFGVFENFQLQHPGKFMNMGIAEQNMVSVASGLAKEGYFPVVYTIIPFLTMRAFEQIRIDICLHNRNVLLVGVGGGYSYDILGPTHHALEDLAIMRTLPELKIYTPGTPDDISSLSDELFSGPGPRYLRLGKNGEKNLSSDARYDAVLGAVRIGNRSANVLVSHGPISDVVEQARLELEENKIAEFRHYSILRNEPISRELFNEISEPGNSVFFIEEVYETGSAYDEFARYLARDQKISELRTYALHPPKNFMHKVGGRISLLESIGMSKAGIYEFVLDGLERR